MGILTSTPIRADSALVWGNTGPGCDAHLFQPVFDQVFALTGGIDSGGSK